jgi:hypothetical protein
MQAHRRSVVSVIAIAFVALLAARSEGSAMGRVAVADPQLSLPRVWQDPIHHSIRRIPNVCPSNSFLFNSDMETQNVNEWCSENMAPNQAPINIFPGIGGVGLAASGVVDKRGVLAVGRYAGEDISIYKVVPSTGLLIPLGPLGKLRLGLRPLGFFAEGMCFDQAGGLYAVNFKGQFDAPREIDYYAHAAVVSTGAAFHEPTRRYDVLQTALFQPFYPRTLACAVIGGADIVMVSGIDTQVIGGNVDVGQLALCALPLCAGIVTVSQTFGPFPADFPGGLALSNANDLVMSDPYGGTLDDLGQVYPWNGGYTFCTVPNNPTDYYLDIAFDYFQDAIWANHFAMDANQSVEMSNAIPPFAGLPCTTPAPPGGPSELFPDEQWEGIAVSNPS